MNNTCSDRRPELSFCIPIKNRFDDIQATLRQNLDDNRADEAQIEFILICFDDFYYPAIDEQNEHSLSPNVRQWIELNFADELASGYLRFYHLDGLPDWHFGKAKNAFKPYIKGKIYASLDGDNFTGKHAGRHIIDVFRQHHYQCILHQFQGDYGDGTCGRIALKREHYMQWGYDEHFLPRQWDELDAILTTLVNHPEVTYLCYVGQGKNIIQRSYPIRRYLKEHNREFKQQEIADPGLFSQQDTSAAAVGQHDPDYVGQDIHLRLASIYNNHLSLIKNSDRPDLIYRYEQELMNCQQNMLQQIEPQRLKKWFLNPLSNSSHGNNPQEANTLLFGWIDHTKMDHNTFSAWHEHHCQLGVECFFLVVDSSARFSGFDTSLFPDVQLLEPAVSLPQESTPASSMFLLEILLKVHGQNKQCYLLGEDPWVPVDLTRLQVPAGKNITGAILSHDYLVNPLLESHLCEYVKTARTQKQQSTHRIINKVNKIIQRLLGDLEALKDRSISHLKKHPLSYNGPILLNWQPDMSLSREQGKLSVTAKQQRYSYVRFTGAKS